MHLLTKSKLTYIVTFCLTIFFLLNLSQNNIVVASSYGANYPISMSAEANGKSYTYIDVIGSQIFVYNETDNRVERFTRSGNNAVYTEIIDSGFTVTGMAHDSANNLYLADSTNHRVKRYAAPNYDLDITYIVTTSNGPWGLAIDQVTGDMYVASLADIKIIKISPAGNQSDFITDPTNEVLLSYPNDLTISNGYLYVTNTSYPLLDGNMITYKALSGGDAYTMVPSTQTSSVMRVATDKNDSVYFTNYSTGQISMFVYSKNRVFTGMVNHENFSEFNNIVDMSGSGDFVYFLRSSNAGSPNVINEVRAFMGQILVSEEMTVNDLNTGSNLTNIGKGGGGMGVYNALIGNSYDGTILAEVEVEIETDLDWETTGLFAYTDTVAGSSVIHGLLDMPGVNVASFTLYVPIPTGMVSNAVHICPGAEAIEDVYEGCSGGSALTVNGTTVTKFIDPNTLIEYWRVEGMTGTGGISITESGAAADLVIEDTMTRLQAGEFSNHSIFFGTVNGVLSATDLIEISFSMDWDLGYLTSDDFDFIVAGLPVPLLGYPDVDSWGLEIDTANNIIVLYPPTEGVNYADPLVTLELLVGTHAIEEGIEGENQILNPYDVGEYVISILITNAMGSEYGSATVPIVDSDQVNVTGYVDTFISFDIDTAVADANCAYNICLTHENGGAGSNYTVDLGELNSTTVNKSNDTSVMHSDGNDGIINSIWLDLTTNAYNGAVVYVVSENAGLQGPNASFIATVAEAANIEANDGAYGFQLTEDPAISSGNISRNGNCIVATSYCSFQTTPQTVFTTNTEPLDTGRIRMDIAAAASYTNNPGLYTDTLTFMVVATF